jgi:hypothetical protein
LLEFGFDFCLCWDFEPLEEPGWRTVGVVLAGGVVLVVGVVDGDVGVVPVFVGVRVVPVPVVPVVVVWAHDSVTPRTGSLTGSEIAESGVPGGTSTLNVSFAPPATVTVTTHSWALAAVGSRPSPATSDPVAATQTRSFRLITVTCCLPLIARSQPRVYDHEAAFWARY